MAVSRASAKLQAALVQFRLEASVRGARAVDVGASTGGFSEALLAAGAASVLAVDVGHGQLHPSLRNHPKVTSLEGSDWRRLPLDVAEGPFDFFTVDVSFVAARNMLRALAFRLRPGAEGVVLVKPQFEVPDRGRGRYIDDPERRREALEKVRLKAEALGFSLVEQADSPTAGAEGTIEVLAHLRFAGRPAALPQPGERRRETKPLRPRRAPTPGDSDRGLRWFAVVAPGLEQVAEREIARLPAISEVTPVEGGIEWSGSLDSGFLANLTLSISTRVLVRVGSVEAREFGKLRRRAARLPWPMFVGRGGSVAVRASAHRCRLFHTGGLAENTALAIADAVPGARPVGPGDPADVSVLVRGTQDRFTFSVDASGERLHRRGARIESGAAPLRETLAAGLLALAGWQPGTPLVDPTCGAGTIVIEAGTQALGRPAGLDRAFAMESWPVCATPELAAAATRMRDQARASVRAETAAPISGSDHDPRTIESARRNAARAGLESIVTFACRDLSDARPTAPTGLVIANPPYGRRLGDARTAARVYRDLGRVLRAHFRGWRAAVVAPARIDAARAVGVPVAGRFPLRNSGLAVALCVFEL
jgi:putative N6-adenine-specific DNA methylase